MEIKTALILFILLMPIITQAEEEESFYPKNFPLDFELHDNASPLTKERNKNIAAKGASHVESPALNSKESEIKPHNQKFEDQGTDQIISLGVIVNSNKKEHFDKVLRELLATVNEKNFFIGRIIEVGSSPGKIKLKTLNEKLEFGLRRASIQFEKNVPDKYQVKGSPTWIVETKKGEILFEGFNKTNSFITSLGKVRRKILNSFHQGDSLVDPSSEPTKNNLSQGDEDRQVEHLELEKM